GDVYKRQARSLAMRAGVPVVPGYEGDADDPARMLEEARKIGFPLLVKASAGGGGKGMRRVDRLEDLPAALAAAGREAEAAFGDGRLLLERLLEDVRHVEIQILCDAGGRAIHLGERDCSVQRRHQKIVEQSPSPAVGDRLRARMGEAVIALARESGYRNAGTVEFLLAPDGSFYFLEVNTRLQVEHPVTEAVTGIDIVHAMLRIASGEPLPVTQGDVVLRGHAIEARVYAEDPKNGFLPAAGTVLLYREPSGPGIRVDSGILAGSEVTVHYDPILAKVIAHHGERDLARRRLCGALSQMVVLGVATNLPFLQDVLAHPRFAAGQETTRFVEEAFGGWTGCEPEAPDQRLAAAAMAEVFEAPGRGAGGAPGAGAALGGSGGDPYSPWRGGI
ncbi:MAG: 3-methylcrotonyl-CoA carboxylase, partial [Candidatus Eisenbacteria bacterium]|nr:3-methylcrotonyl-CoA carboxylase [Candidatus Eisenbacteria bacterium]